MQLAGGRPGAAAEAAQTYTVAHAHARHAELDFVRGGAGECARVARP